MIMSNIPYGRWRIRHKVTVILSIANEREIQVADVLFRSLNYAQVIERVWQKLR